MEGMLIPLGLFGMITAIIIFITSRRHRERMELIKRGLNPVRVAPPRTGSKSLFLGLAGVAIGIAVMINILINYSSFDNETFMIGLCLLFGGVAFLLYWKMTAGDRARAIKAYEQHLEDEKSKSEQVAAVPAEESADIEK